jgi:hypothetical protein
MNDELERIWKEAVVAEFEVLPALAWMDNKTMKSLSVSPTSGQKSEPGTSRIRNGVLTAWRYDIYLCIDKGTNSAW